MYKAIFFDVDETLVDASHCHHQADVTVFEQYGIDFKMVKDAVGERDFIGMKIAEIMQIMKTAVGLDEKEAPLADFLHLRNEVFMSLVKTQAKLMPGAVEALELAAEMGKRIALVSSGERRYLKLVCEVFALEKYVEYVVGAEDVVNGKPFPDCYLKAFAQLHDLTIQKDQVLVVEDSRNGVKAAKSAGLKVVQVPFVKYDPVEIEADYVVQSLIELIEKKYYD